MSCKHDLFHSSHKTHVSSSETPPTIKRAKTSPILQYNTQFSPPLLDYLLDCSETSWNVRAHQVVFKGRLTVAQKAVCDGLGIAHLQCCVPGWLVPIDLRDDSVMGGALTGDGGDRGGEGRICARTTHYLSFSNFLMAKTFRESLAHCSSLHSFDFHG